MILLQSILWPDRPGTVGIVRPKLVAPIVFLAKVLGKVLGFCRVRGKARQLIPSL